MKLLIALIAAAAAAIAVGTASADVSQTPVTTGCPAGYEHLSVASLEATGPYRLPRRLDTAGNNNGFVCGLALPEAVAAAYCRNLEPGACNLVQLGLPLYLFDEDDNPASQ